MPYSKSSLSILLSLSLTFSACALDGCSKSNPSQSSATPQAQGGQGQAPATTNAQPSADQLYQLVAPIALFPDNLVAQVLAGSTFPDQVSAATAWLKQNSNLKGDQLMQTVNEQPWDNSIKGLTQFPDVLNQMASNLSWTSALGDAYYNFPKDVMNAVQVMRQRAYDAGNLKSGQQQNVTVQNQAPASAPPPASTAPDQTTTIVQPPAQTIIIQPAQPDVVYVPTYNPTVVYGAPVAAYPGYSTGDMVATGLISFGLGMAVGAAISNNNGCCGWGYNSWGCGWNNSTVVYNHNTYISNSNTFSNRNNYYNRNNNYNRNNINANNINRNNLNNNNLNRNNVNANNLNRNNNNRTNNFDSNKMSTPNFGSKYNQSQFNNSRGNYNQTAANRAGGPNNQNLAANRTGPNNQNLAANRPGANNQNRPNAGQAQRDPARGYGQQANRGTSSGAFSNYGQGGQARTNSARGQQSFQGGRSGNSGGGRAANAGGGRAGNAGGRPHR
jgi:hypothetical protein